MNEGLLNSFGAPPTPGVPALVCLGSLTVIDGVTALSFPSILAPDIDEYTVWIRQVRQKSGSGAPSLALGFLLDDGTILETTVIGLSVITDIVSAQVNLSGLGAASNFLNGGLVAVQAARGFQGGTILTKSDTAQIFQSPSTPKVKGLRIRW